MQVHQEKVHFTSASGQRLAARIERPTGSQPRDWALFAHCFSCSKDLKAVGWFTRELVSRGFGVLRLPLLPPLLPGRSAAPQSLLPN